MKIIFRITCFLLISVKSLSQDYFPLPDESDLPGAKFGISKTFTGSSLFGHINGGAELYLEYGFSGVSVNEIEYKGRKFAVEIYRMNGPEEAFGVFSVSRFKCNNTPGLSRFTCQTPYQLQICSGCYYISIVNNSGKMEDSEASLKIGESIVNRIKESSAGISDYLPGIPDEIVDHGAVLVKGSIGVMNGTPDLTDFFENASGYLAVVLPWNEQTIVSVKFSAKKDMIAFTSRHNWDTDLLLSGNEMINKDTTISMIGENHLLITISNRPSIMIKDTI